MTKQRFQLPVEFVATPFQPAIKELKIVKIANEYALHGYTPTSTFNMSGFVIQEFVNYDLLSLAAESFAEKLAKRKAKKEEAQDLGEPEVIPPKEEQEQEEQEQEEEQEEQEEK